MQIKKKLIFKAALVLSLGLVEYGEKEDIVVLLKQVLLTKLKNADSNKEMNQIVVDHDKVKATLVKIVPSFDSIFGNSYEIIFEVDNKGSEKK